MIAACHRRMALAGACVGMVYRVLAASVRVDSISALARSFDDSSLSIVVYEAIARSKSARRAAGIGFERRLLAIHAADDEIHGGELRVLVADLLVGGERLIELTLVAQRVRGRQLLLDVLGQRAGNRSQVAREDEVHRHRAGDAHRPLGFLLRNSPALRRRTSTCRSSGRSSPSGLCRRWST